MEQVLGLTENNCVAEEDEVEVRIHARLGGGLNTNRHTCCFTSTGQHKIRMQSIFHYIIFRYLFSDRCV